MLSWEDLALDFKVLVCVLLMVRASISIRVNQSALNSECFYREWKWWVCKEDRAIRVKAAKGIWGTTAGCLLFANTPDSSDVSLQWLPFEIQMQMRNLWINSVDQVKKKLLCTELFSCGLKWGRDFQWSSFWVMLSWDIIWMLSPFLFRKHLCVVSLV